MQFNLKKEGKGLHMKNTPEEDGCKFMVRYQTKKIQRMHLGVILQLKFYEATVYLKVCLNHTRSYPSNTVFFLAAVSHIFPAR